MKKSRYTAEQVTFALRQAESGTPVPEVCRTRWASASRPFIGGRSGSSAQV